MTSNAGVMTMRLGFNCTARANAAPHAVAAPLVAANVVANTPTLTNVDVDDANADNKWRGFNTYVQNIILVFFSSPVIVFASAWRGTR